MSGQGVRIIRVKVPRDGISEGKTSVQFETQGFQGTACSLATQGLVASLGGKVVADEATAEMYEQEQQHEHLNNG